jgi:hypothetical protein
MNRIESIHVAPTTDRKASPGRFETALRSAAAGLAGGVAASVELAAPYVPGGTVLSAAVRSAANGVARGVAPSGVSASSSSSSTTSSSPAGGAGDRGGDLLEATRALQEQAQSFNLQYLQLQESMQRESREFTALSNVMKVKHETAKSAINNVH